MNRFSTISVTGLLLAMMLLSGCIGQKAAGDNAATEPELPQTRITAAYFPVEPGLYKRFKDGEGGWEETVQQPEQFHGREVTPVKVKRLDAVAEQHSESIELVNYRNFYQVTECAVELVGMESEISEGEVYSDLVDPSWVMLMLGMQQGSEWMYEMYNPPGTVKVSVVGFETVKVAAGVFEEAVKLRLQSEYVTEAGETEKTTHFEWYAPGVGLVKVKGATAHKDAELVEIK